MSPEPRRVELTELTRFDRKFFEGAERFTYIGEGKLGGKAQGLANIDRFLAEHFDQTRFPQLEVSIPTLTVITTQMFDKFMEQNDLYEVALSERRDDQLALAFQQADLPAELVGDLRALITKVKQPLAVRSSSLAEDA
ncbi:MAG: PEP/pyruvate-binding domain-containing protein, partial [bacterium]